MAIQSAALLCRHLVARPSAALSGQPAEIGRDYASEWRKLFGPRIRAASLFAQISMSSRVAKGALPVMKRFPALLTVGAHLAGKANQMPTAS